MATDFYLSQKQSFKSYKHNFATSQLHNNGFHRNVQKCSELLGSPTNDSFCGDGDVLKYF